MFQKRIPLSARTGASRSYNGGMSSGLISLLRQPTPSCMAMMSNIGRSTKLSHHFASSAGGRDFEKKGEQKTGSPHEDFTSWYISPRKLRKASARSVVETLSRSGSLEMYMPRSIGWSRCRDNSSSRTNWFRRRSRRIIRLKPRLLSQKHIFRSKPR